MSETIGTIRKAGVIFFLCASIAAVGAANPRAEELYQTAVINHEKNPDLALSAINAAVKLDPTIFKYQKERGTILLESDEYSEAIKSLDIARKMNDKDPDLLCTRVECLRYLKRWQEALSDMHEAIRLSPKPTASLFQHEARLYLHMEQFGPADAAIKASLKLDQNNLTAQFDEMKILQSWKKWNELTEFITNCLKQKHMRHRDEMEFLLRRANAFTALKDYDKAIADYKLMAIKAPDTRQPHAGLLDVYKTMGKTAEANKEKSWLAEYDADIIPTK